jgi:hypothetical protein
MMKTMQTMELIETLFDETRNVINQRLDTLERQVNLVLHHNSMQNNYSQSPCSSNSCAQENKSSYSSRDNEREWVGHFNGLSQKLNGISNFLDQMNYRLKQLEENSQSHKTQTHLRTPILGPQHLEGLVMVPEIKVTKENENDYDTKNIIIQPNFVIPDTGSTNIQEYTDLQKKYENDDEIPEDEEQENNEQDDENEEVEVQEDDVEVEGEGEVEGEEEVEVEEEEKQEDDKQEEVQDDEVEEDTPQVEDETLELEEFVFKNKKYFKDQFNKVYRQIDDETPEDEPFAEYNETTNKLTRI